MRLWSIEGELIRSFDGAISPGESGERVAFALDGHAVIARLRDGDLCRWNAETGAIEAKLVGAGALLAIDSSGRRAQPISVLGVRGDDVVNAAMTPDGRHALLGVGALELWDLEAGERVRRIERAPPQSREVGPIAISADGSFRVRARRCARLAKRLSDHVAPDGRGRRDVSGCTG